MSDPRERIVVAWSRWPSQWWVIERSYPLRYAEDVILLSLDEERDRRGRRVRLFEQGVNPND